MSTAIQKRDDARVVLITGCSSGIGKATALRLAAAGHTVYATARKPAAFAELGEKCSRLLALDVCDAATMDAAVATIEAEHGAVDVLVNNAGFSQSGAVEAVPIDRVRAQFETNVFGVVQLTQRVLPAMRRRKRGRIINLSSMGGRLVFPGGGYYHATKYAIEAISDALRFELRGFGIQVVLIEPGLIRTNFGEAASGSIDAPADPAYAEFHAAVAKATKESYEKGPLARLAGEADDVARTIEHAITTRRPRARYSVSASAKLLLAQRALLSDRLWDLFLRSSFPTPA
jgi:NAD(P)-dependent dehydrogenase (short-subunit alcohol dehydrogenase family)